MPVALEIDTGIRSSAPGWMVMIIGRAEEVSDVAEIERLDGFELDPRCAA